MATHCTLGNAGPSFHGRRSPLVCRGWRTCPSAGKPGGAGGVLKLSQLVQRLVDIAQHILGSESKESRNALRVCIFFLT